VTVVSSSDSLFDQPCLDAVRRWKFLPRTIDGQPVEQDGIVRLYFSRKTNYWSG
jgi:outer membrane biosynthesis protein TonB